MAHHRRGAGGELSENLITTMTGENAKVRRNGPGFATAILGALCAFAFSFVLAGCSPKPDPGLVLWEQPAPKVAAEAHAREIAGWAQRVADTGSMMPLMAADDWMVTDVRAQFADVREGWVCLYKSRGLPANSAPVAHMAAARSGDTWIMTGLANPNYERGEIAMTRHDFIGHVVQVYTRRAKP